MIAIRIMADAKNVPPRSSSKMNICRMMHIISFLGARVQEIQEVPVYCYCSVTSKTRRKKNDLRRIMCHVEKCHSEKLSSATSLQSNTQAYGGMVNDGAETETDFLGHNGPSDDDLANHLTNVMSRDDSGNQDDISHEYSSPPPGSQGCRSQ